MQRGLVVRMRRKMDDTLLAVTTFSARFANASYYFQKLLAG
jgi:hypothetical protein